MFWISQAEKVTDVTWYIYVHNKQERLSNRILVIQQAGRNDREDEDDQIDETFQDINWVEIKKKLDWNSLPITRIEWTDDVETAIQDLEDDINETKQQSTRIVIKIKRKKYGNLP